MPDMLDFGFGFATGADFALDFFGAEALVAELDFDTGAFLDCAFDCGRLVCVVGAFFFEVAAFLAVSFGIGIDMP
jgi:hypothetical protein